MQLTFDPVANIAYIRFRKRAAKVKTVVVSDGLHVDLGADGKIYGIELMNAREQLTEGKLPAIVLKNASSGKQAELSLSV